MARNVTSPVVTMAAKQACVVGVDVGTAAARAAVVAVDSGRTLAVAVRPLDLYNPQPDHWEQSSAQIWHAVGEAVRAAVAEACVQPEDVCGVGFDATCSLVLLGPEDEPVSVSSTGQDNVNVLLWMDHRSLSEAARVNATQHDVLRFVGGSISPEMQVPKLMWLKHHLPASYARARRFFDLVDFLTFAATGDDTRSLCTLACKWTFRGHASAALDLAASAVPPADGGGGVPAGFDPSFFHAVGLGELANEGFRRILGAGGARPLGEAVGQGLTPQAAAWLGLRAGTPVGVGAIDAHAGALGTLGMDVRPAVAAAAAQAAAAAATRSDWLAQRMAMVSGTSACHLVVSPRPHFVRGLWGPYCGALIPGLWLSEAGQSAAGALLDATVAAHAEFVSLQRETGATGPAGGAVSGAVYRLLNAELERMAAEAGVGDVALLTAHLHVLPHHHGNRSPLADPTLLGAVHGLRLRMGARRELALLYLATLQGLALGARHIIDALDAQRARDNDSAGAPEQRIGAVAVSGGLTHNPLYLRVHADAMGVPLGVPAEGEAVLLGAAVLAARAAGCFGSLEDAMTRMSRLGSVVHPNAQLAPFYTAKYRVMLAMHEDQLRYRAIMESVEGARPEAENHTTHQTK